MNYRISKLREYLFGIIDTLTTSKYQINADMLSNNIEDYSLDKIPTEQEVEQWIIGETINKDDFNFRCLKLYSQDTMNNLKNIGFFEDLQLAIKTNNEEGNLPDIPGIEKIECLSSGALNFAGTDKAEFAMQIRITYRGNMVE